MSFSVSLTEFRDGSPRSTAMAAGGQHCIPEAHDGRSESEALRSIWKPAKPFRHDVGRGAAHEKPAVAGGFFDLIRK